MSNNPFDSTTFGQSAPATGPAQGAFGTLPQASGPAEEPAATEAPAQEEATAKAPAKKASARKATAKKTTDKPTETPASPGLAALEQDIAAALVGLPPLDAMQAARTLVTFLNERADAAEAFLASMVGKVPGDYGTFTVSDDGTVTPK